LRVKFVKLLHKILRDKARLYFLCKDKKHEVAFESDAAFMYGVFCEEMGVKIEKDGHKDTWGFPILNIKVIKIMFNRAYRMSTLRPQESIEIFEAMLVKLG
jgi:hypothetical protein